MTVAKSQFKMVTFDGPLCECEQALVTLVGETITNDEKKNQHHHRHSPSFC